MPEVRSRILPGTASTGWDAGTVLASHTRVSHWGDMDGSLPSSNITYSILRPSVFILCRHCNQAKGDLP